MRAFASAAKLICLAAVPMIFAAFAPANAASLTTVSTLYDFCAQPNCADGDIPTGVVRDASGNLYGVTELGGSHSNGVAFEIVGRNHHYKILYNFCRRTNCTDGDAPAGALIMDVNGNLYGTTLGGGKHGSGAVYELMPSADHRKWSLTVLYSFCRQSGCADGASAGIGLTYEGAQSGVPYDGVSPLYGVTSQGGGAGSGVVYEITSVPGQIKRDETILYSFCAQQPTCTDGGAPLASLAIDGVGDLFGTAPFGGGKSGGVVYELAPDSTKTTWTYSIVYGFCTRSLCKDGESPDAPVILDGNGNLFGTTPVGGAHGLGTVFKIALAPPVKETVLYDFCSQANCTDGEIPQAGLLMDGSGNLFGTTNAGGAVDSIGGTAFELQGSTLTVLYSFCSQANCTDGAGPNSGLVSDGAGNLFGTTSFFGEHTGGTAYEISP